MILKKYTSRDGLSTYTMNYRSILLTSELVFHFLPLWLFLDIRMPDEAIS